MFTLQELSALRPNKLIQVHTFVEDRDVEIMLNVSNICGYYEFKLDDPEDEEYGYDTVIKMVNDSVLRVKETVQEISDMIYS